MKILVLVPNEFFGKEVIAKWLRDAERHSQREENSSSGVSGIRSAHPRNSYRRGYSPPYQGGAGGGGVTN